MEDAPYTYVKGNMVFQYNHVRTVCVYTQRHFDNSLHNGMTPWPMTYIFVHPASTYTQFVNACEMWIANPHANRINTPETANR